MNRPYLRAAVFASLAALLATAVLAVPAAGAVGSVSTDSQVVGDATTHRFAVGSAQSGTLESVSVDDRSGTDAASQGCSGPATALVSLVPSTVTQVPSPARASTGPNVSVPVSPAPAGASTKYVTSRSSPVGAK